MKKITKLLLSALFIALLIFFGASCKNRKPEKSDSLDEPPIKILDAIVAALQEKIDYKDRDEVSISPNSELETIEIRTQETAELLFNCIRNSKKIVEFNNKYLESANCFIMIGGEKISNFDSIYIDVPQISKFYRVVFAESDAEALYEHIMKLKDREIIDKIVAILQDKIFYEDQDELSVLSNDKIKSIKIKTPETAELLYRCIKNCEEIVDLTGVDPEPMLYPVEIQGVGNCDFDNRYIRIRRLGKLYQIVFTESDAAEFYEHVMKLKDEYIAGQSKQ